jgi:hypothetical protein
MSKARTQTTFPNTSPNGNELPESIPPAGDTDAWDFESLRVPQDFSAMVKGQKVLTAVSVRKPNKQEFIRVHPDAAWQFTTALLVENVDRETYLVDPALWSTLESDISRYVLFTTVNRQGVLFLWPARLPSEDRRASAWHESALEAVSHAMQNWVRVVANTQAGAYEVFRAINAGIEPEWPTDVTFETVMRLAFKGRFINDIDHPVLKRLRGEF